MIDYEKEEALEKRLIRIESRIHELSIRVDGLKNMIVGKCQHESNGLYYPDLADWSQCLKCGEFYR